MEQYYDNTNSMLTNNLNILILSHLRTTKNPWKTFYMNITESQKDYLRNNFHLNTKFKQSYSIIDKLKLKTCRFFPNQTMCTIKKDQLHLKFTRKRKLKYYVDANLTVGQIEENNNRLTVKFLVEREILINQNEALTT